jgi:hypothetical protein
MVFWWRVGSGGRIDVQQICTLIDDMYAARHDIHQCENAYTCGAIFGGIRIGTQEDRNGDTRRKPFTQLRLTSGLFKSNIICAWNPEKWWMEAQEKISKTPSK